MAEPWEWEEEDLLALVDNEASESLTLDFKECAALDKSDRKKREVSKDVSAFANSAGGTLVYGLIEDKKRRVAHKLDDGYDPSDISQEWLDQVINSNIQPRLSGVRIKTVHLTKERLGRVVHVVYVPQSMTAHPAADKKYYKRFNFESVPMEDYEIRDTMHRALEPRVSVHVAQEGNDSPTLKFNESGDGSFSSPALEFYVVNEPGAAVAQYLQVHIFTADTLKVDAGPGRQSRTTLRLPGGYVSYHYREHVISPGDVPLFSGERRLVDGFRITIAGGWESGLLLPLILWRARSNDMDPRHGAIVFDKIMPGIWDIKAATVDDLPPGYSLEFAP